MRAIAMIFLLCMSSEVASAQTTEQCQLAHRAGDLLDCYNGTTPPRAPAKPKGLVRELWRMVRSGGKLSVTTWGPRIFEPAYSRWLAAIEQERPDLHNAFNPWDRITDVESVRCTATSSRSLRRVEI